MIVPLLSLACGVDLRYAVGASLVSVIATSSGAASAYVREGFTNVRVGMVLEIATTFGALAGAFIAGFVSTSVIAIVFGIVLLYSAYLTLRPHAHATETPGSPSEAATRDRVAVWLHLYSTYPGSRGPEPYTVKHVGGGFGLMLVAGVLSGLLGIGSGAVKVLAMDQVMRLPFKVSTTTSNFMIGVTAAASAGVYLHRGYIDPGLSLPVMLGVLLGAFAGARLLPAARTHHLRWVFGSVVVLLAIEMLYNGATGRL